MIGTRSGRLWHIAGLAVFLAATMFVLFLLLELGGGVKVGARYHVTAVVPSALQLSTAADVKQAGVTIGSVDAIANRAGTAVLRLAIEPRYGPLHQDARVQIRAKTLVGENYVDVDPGTAASPPLRDGATLPLARAAASVQLDDILSTLSPSRRQRLRRLFAGLGPGLGDSRGTGAAITGITDLLAGGKHIVYSLDDQREALRGLVANLGSVFAAVGQQKQQVARFVDGALRASRLVAGEDRALRAGLREIPATLRQVSATTTHLAGVGTRATPVLDDLSSALTTLTPATRDLPDAARATLGALREIARTAPAARRLLGALRGTAAPAASFVPQLDDVIRQLRPAVSYLAPYAKDFGSFFGGLGQAAETYDAVGHLARIQPVLSQAALAIFGTSERQAVEQLVGAGAARIVTLDGTNNYPKPNTLATPQAFTGSYPRLTKDPGGSR